MSLAAGTRLGPYEILASLGAGGMGEVYRARDRKLDRDVAVKVLPQATAADPDALARFEREAKAVAALSHPNILSIFDFGSEDGVAYAVMELLEGETLRGKLDAGPIPQKQAVDYTLQIAKGLAAAHERGIVHRDLKPENLFVSRDGHLKILDFGLAKRVESVTPDEETSAPTGSGHTEPGTVMGTAGYMSPEQVKGLPVDHRSDIFSFGAILYELLSGRKAFRRETNVETMAAILRDEPPELSESGRNVSPALERVVKHCLEKDRDHRFQSARDIAFNLSDPSSPAAARSAAKVTAPASPSGFRIAVLPFKCGTADADVLALADGLSEEIVSGLSRFRYLSVVASASAGHRQDDRDEGTPDAGSGARYVVEGSIRREGSDLRVGAQLVDVRTGARLWSDTYRRDLQASGIFAVQDDVAGRIVATVADSYGVLVHSIRASSGQKDDTDLTPVEWQFQYFAYREQITPSAYATLKSRLERAVERNGRQSDLWACLAQVYVDEYAFGFGGDAVSLDRALAAARRAVELDRANQFALVALAQVHFFRQDLAAFGPAAERAMALNPLNTDAVGILGLQIVHTGEFERGATIVRRAMELNPNHAGWMHFAPLWEHFHKGEFEQALERANRVDVPGLFWPFLVVASACGHLGRRVEAESAVRDLLALDPDFAAHARSNVGTWHFASGLMDPILEGLRKAGLSIPASGDDGSSGAGGGFGAVRAKSDSAPRTASGPARADESFWVAVLPFKYGGADASLTALAEGLTEEIVTGLSRFSYLRVISRSAPGDSRSAGKQVGARYVMEGSLRQSGTRLRIAVQLVDAVSGAHLWAENYERSFSPEAVFELQDELVPRIVSTVADMHGVLPRSMSETVRGRTPEQLSPYEAVLRSFGYFELANREELAAARSGLESAVRRAPAYADAWAMLSILCTHAYGQAFNRRPDSLTTGFAAARRAVDAAPSNHLAWFSLAQALFFQKEFQSFRNAAERAVALNPMDGDSIATLGGMLTCAGDLERGLALTGRAKQLNPHHPGWYWWVDFCNAYRQGDYRAALGFALKMNLPGHWFMHAAMSAAYGQLGERAAASKALQDLLEMRPDFGATVRMNIEKWWESDFVEHLMDGWRKAGLEIPTANATAARPPDFGRSSATDSGAARADEGFWVAVLPFKAGGAGGSVTTLAEGLSEEIVTGLSRFSYLKVIARGATADGRSATDLGARYVMEGSLRLSGTRLRVAVQLVDAATGAHLWAESYERTFSADAVFELQDELAPRIVSTVADMNGILPRSMSQAVRSRAPEQLSPYEAVLRSFVYFERVNAEELASARAGLEAAVQKAPAYADAWAMLALLCVQDHAQGFDLQAHALTSGASAARRAVEAAPSNPLAHFSLAQALFFQKEFEGFRNAADRAVALNPMDGNSIAFLGELLTYASDRKRGMELAGRAKQLNPNHPGWYWYADFYDAYRNGDDRAAVNFALRADLPGHWGMHAALAAAYGQLGEHEAAGRALRDLLRLRPGFAATARHDSERWWEPEYVERMIDGWRKAGLEIDDKGVPVRPTPAGASESTSGAARADEGFWVAVLPFKHSGAGASLATLADGMSDEIVTGLSRFSYLRVISQASTRRYSSAAADVRTVGKELGARYVLDGSLRQAGPALRASIQLSDAESGAHLWAETYERPFRPYAVFELQDDLVSRIVATVGDPHGILPHTMSESLRSRDPGELSPYEAVLRAFGFGYRSTPEEHAFIRDALEKAVRDAPRHADAWALLSLIYTHEYAHEFNVLPDPIGRALDAARRAVALAPTSAVAYDALAWALFFRKEVAAFRAAAEQAVALNPLSSPALAGLGTLTAYSGEWEKGCAMVQRALQLNPRHPGWYRFALFADAYRRRDYRGAVEIALKLNLPDFYVTHEVLAAAYGQIGERESAAKALKELLRLRPDYAETGREKLEKWLDPELVEHWMDGLRKAGLDAATGAASTAPAKPPSEVSIAVLPFSDMSPAKDQEFLCEGMAEEIMNALVGIEGMRVASRTSAFRARKEGGDVQAIARSLSVGHVLEGSVRAAGSRLRVTAQLTDAGTGYQLWSERFDRDAADIFAVQDEIAAGVVEAVKSRLSPGEHAVPARPQPVNLDAYRSYLQGRHLRGKEHLVDALRAFEEAVRLDPSYAPSWTGLAEATVLASLFGLIPAREACSTARKALTTATRLQGESAEGLHVEAFVAWIERRWEAMETAWRRAIELQPNNVLALASFGIVLCTRQRLDEALPLFERARQADPLASFPYTLTGGGLLNCGRLEEALRYLDDALSFEKEDATALDDSGMALVALGRFEEGIARLEHVVAVSHRAPHFLGTLGWALATAGRKDEARSILDELRARPPGSPAVVSEACLLGALGEVDAAFDVIARAEEECLAYLYFTGIPALDSLRGDPRFGALLERLGLSSE